MYVEVPSNSALRLNDERLNVECSNVERPNVEQCYKMAECRTTKCRMAECLTRCNVEILQHCTPVKIELTTPNLT
jgi:hypothetical protein